MVKAPPLDSMVLMGPSQLRIFSDSVKTKSTGPGAQHRLFSLKGRRKTHFYIQASEPRMVKVFEIGQGCGQGWFRTVKIVKVGQGHSGWPRVIRVVKDS